ncbi:hypothetical protein [Halogeometricum limi]|uniref:DUF5518 domain-containing protein n=1 Tax=Halogeometricum limi TaxID=555875 RepID=A0A1I6HMG7_9EURY|nr:hypothetical protein [Halogeometricum limi]SFR55614.1 hypothetical protein SAMN04488124_2397 [Halogeometricum limi]
MQRTDEREPSTFDVSLDSDEDGDAVSSPRDGSSNGGRLFSPKRFVGVFVAALLASFLGGAIPLVGFVGRFLALFVVGFAVGALSHERRYLEVGLAGGLVSGLLLALSTLTSALALAPFALRLVTEYGLAIAGVGVGVGFLVSVVGHYFGRDLRDGLTREI